MEHEREGAGQEMATDWRSTTRLTDYWLTAEAHAADVVTEQRELYLDILGELGHDRRRIKTVLDLGCGMGQVVEAFCDAGFDAYGCDIRLREASDRLRLVEGDRLPFPDGTFDLIVSGQVLEHIQRHETVMQETCRVLKPGGTCLHIFPSKLRPIESHIFVPFAGFIQAYSWLLLWAWLGVREPTQKGRPSRSVARENFVYLRDHTRYLSRTQILEACRMFDDVRFVEEHYLEYTRGKARHLHRILGLAPFLSSAYAALFMRVLYLAKAGDDRVGCAHPETAGAALPPVPQAGLGPFGAAAIERPA